MIAIELKGRTALVTGAARGIGAAVARQLARAGAGVALVDLPNDIAHLVAFLASDLADYVTGQSIFVDGGRTFCK